MSKNRIIPQMCDVRPVNKTGDLDWRKIQSIGGAGVAGSQAVSRPSLELPAKKVETEKLGAGENAYILGVPVKSSAAPIFHDSTFRLDDFAGVGPAGTPELRLIRQKRELAEIAEKESREAALEQSRILAESRRAEQQLLQSQRSQAEAERVRLLAAQAKREAEKKELELQQKALRDMEIARQEKAAALAAEQLKVQARAEAQRQFLILQEQQRLESERAEKIAREQAILAEQEKSRLERQLSFQREQLLKAQAEKLLKKQKNQAAHVDWLTQLQKKTSDRQKEAGNLFSWRELIFPAKLAFQFDTRSSLAIFAAVALFMSLSVGGVSYASKGLGMKGKVLGVSQDGYANLTGAMSDMAQQNFEGSAVQFSQALANFSTGSSELEDMGGILLDATRFIPFASMISSGKNAVEAGKHFSAAGQALNEVVKVAATLKNPIDQSAPSDVSLLKVLESGEVNIALAKSELDSAQKNIDLIVIGDLPEDKQAKFLLLKQKLPDIRSALDLFLNNSHILVELLGGNGPRKYLFLFQNNSEMRATGGFIGSYGLLDISNGHVKKFFIDGIFNPDGQLKDKIVPPVPIQKISANWSMHDSNWFADFPVSAQKAITFYEKTGGPTADGVITLTPTLLQKFLEITGPIAMPEYDVTLDSQNFIELTQFKVEVDYDKQENKPKKILSDLAPLVLEKLFSSRDLDSISKTAQAILEGLQEKHILFYSQNAGLQEIISRQGWSGEVLPASKDYVSVINTNINGFKTDAIIKESIEHKAEIQADGSVIDTLTVRRAHQGGASTYEWLNKVNANYMRVYVPQGSKLLEVSGQTREENKPPIDYDALGFKRDPDVQREELSIVVDPASGTRVYGESGKTVFGNWTYVSPGEVVSVTYKYLLPFSLFQVAVGGQKVDSYSLVAQKQSGSVGSDFKSELNYPADYNLKWNFPQDAQKNAAQIITQDSLKVDRFTGAVFEKN